MSFLSHHAQLQAPKSRKAMDAAIDKALEGKSLKKDGFAVIHTAIKKAIDDHMAPEVEAYRRKLQAAADKAGKTHKITVSHGVAVIVHGTFDKPIFMIG